jgi:hypothetical protein
MLGVLSDGLFTWSASLAGSSVDAAVHVGRLRREVEVLAGLLQVILPDPQPLAWWDLEVVEPAHQPQVTEIPQWRW